MILMMERMLDDVFIFIEESWVPDPVKNTDVQYCLLFMALRLV